MAVPSELIQVILDRTRERKLRWGELSNTGFTSQIHQNSIIIDYLSPGRYRLTITDSFGTTLEQSDADLQNSELFKEIYESSRRQALRVDDAFLSLQRKLKEL